MMLDSPQACIRELSECAQDLGEFAHLWALNAGELKQKSVMRERLVRAALLKAKGSSKEIREAEAYAAVESQFPDLAQEIEELERKCADFGVRFKGLEKRSSIAQSVLAAYRSEAKMGDHLVDDRLAWTRG